MVSHIYFDWSGTLAKRGSKKTFIYGESINEKCATLRPGVKDMLEHLIGRGYTLGIISNTSKPASLFIKSLGECGLKQYFKGAIILNTIKKGLHRKPASSMFRLALATDRIDASKAMMVGNNYEKDILGAERVGIMAIQIS